MQHSEQYKLSLPLSSITAGFPSPADDFIDKKLDLNELVIKHPVSTFFVRVTGHSMINAGIRNGALLVVDRSLEPHNNDIVVAVVDSDFTVKRFSKNKNKIQLIPENDMFRPIDITGDVDFRVWGVVTYVISEAM